MRCSYHRSSSTPGLCVLSAPFEDKEYCSLSLEALMKIFCKKGRIKVLSMMHLFLQNLFVRASNDEEQYSVFFLWLIFNSNTFYKNQGARTCFSSLTFQDHLLVYLERQFLQDCDDSCLCCDMSMTFLHETRTGLM